VTASNKRSGSSTDILPPWLLWEKSGFASLRTMALSFLLRDTTGTEAQKVTGDKRTILDCG